MPSPLLFSRFPRFRTAAISLFTLMFLCVPLFMPSAWGATCTVTSNADSGTGSLRAMVADITCDTIDFSGSMIITLAPPISVSRTVTIRSDTGWDPYVESSAAVDITIGKGTQDPLTFISIPASAVYSQFFTATATGGSGTGAVTFDVGSSTACTVNVTSGGTNYLAGDTVAIKDAGNLIRTGYSFSGWNSKADGSGTGSCSVTMTSDRSVTASFGLATLLHINGSEYATLQAAYNAAADGDVIQMLLNTTTGKLTADRAVKVRLKGGYDSGYATISGRTTITAPLVIKGGTVILDTVTVK